MNLDKYYKEVKKKFGTKDKNQILTTLKEIRVSGQANILPLLFEILETNKEETVTNEIISILNQLKDKTCVPYIVNALEKNLIIKYRKELIISCWQSGLDYSDHITLFAKEFIKGDYVTAIEAFTVIEEWIFESKPDIVVECKDYLINAISDVSNEKKPLYIELVKLVESYL
jgi:hypothetical protein